MLALGFSSIFFNWVSNALLNAAVVPTFIMGAVTALIPVALMFYIQRYLNKRDAKA
jgi:apolipoprotein N-acyltransferase